LQTLQKNAFLQFLLPVEKVPPLDEEVLRIVAEVKKKRKSAGSPRDDEAVLLDIMARISESYTKFRQVFSSQIKRAIAPLVERLLL
jgi:hypothetical protein